MGRAARGNNHKGAAHNPSHQVNKGMASLQNAARLGPEQAGPATNEQLNYAMFEWWTGAGIEYELVRGPVEGEMPVGEMFTYWLTKTVFLVRLKKHDAESSAGIQKGFVAIIISAINRGVTPACPPAFSKPHPRGQTV